MRITKFIIIFLLSIHSKISATGVHATTGSFLLKIKDIFLPVNGKDIFYGLCAAKISCNLLKGNILSSILGCAATSLIQPNFLYQAKTLYKNPYFCGIIGYTVLENFFKKAMLLKTNYAISIKTVKILKHDTSAIEEQNKLPLQTKEIISAIAPYQFIVLYGDTGTGKTELSKILNEGQGINMPIGTDENMLQLISKSGLSLIQTRLKGEKYINELKEQCNLNEEELFWLLLLKDLKSIYFRYDDITKIESFITQNTDQVIFKIVDGFNKVKNEQIKLKFIITTNLTELDSFLSKAKKINKDICFIEFSNHKMIKNLTDKRKFSDNIKKIITEKIIAATENVIKEKNLPINDYGFCSYFAIEAILDRIQEKIKLKQDNMNDIANICYNIAFKKLNYEFTV